MFKVSIVSNFVDLNLLHRDLSEKSELKTNVIPRWVSENSVSLSVLNVLGHT